MVPSATMSQHSSKLIEWRFTHSTTGQDGSDNLVRMIKEVSSTLTGLNFVRDADEARFRVIPK